MCAAQGVTEIAQLAWYSIRRLKCSVFSDQDDSKFTVDRIVGG